MQNQNTEEIKKEFSLEEVLVILWEKRFIIIIVNCLFVFGSIFYSLYTDEIYEVSSIIRPAQPSEEVTLLESSFFSNLSLVSGKMELPVSKEILSYLYSNSFLLRYYEKYKDKENHLFGKKLTKIRNSSIVEPLKTEKMIETALKMLKDDIIKTTDNGFIMSIAIRHNDKYLAKSFLEEIIIDLRNFMQQKNKTILNDQISYYENVLSSTNDPKVTVTLQNLINKKIEKSFLISTEVFQIIEEPIIPVRRYWPKRSLIVIAASLFGFIFSFFFAVGYSYLSGVYNLTRKKISGNPER